MGNGHAPGTEIGLGAAGVETTATGFGAGCPREAGLAVFFFAAFFIAGFLAGFFLAGFVLTAGFFLAGFVLAAGFFWAAAVLRVRAAGLFFARLVLAANFFRAAADFAFDFAAGLRRALFTGLALPAVFFFAAFFLANFFLLAIRTSVC